MFKPACLQAQQWECCGGRCHNNKGVGVGNKPTIRSLLLSAQHCTNAVMLPTNNAQMSVTGWGRTKSMGRRGIFPSRRNACLPGQQMQGKQQTSHKWANRRLPMGEGVAGRKQSCQVCGETGMHAERQGGSSLKTLGVGEAPAWDRECLFCLGSYHHTNVSCHQERSLVTVGEGTREERSIQTKCREVQTRREGMERRGTNVRWGWGWCRAPRRTQPRNCKRSNQPKSLTNPVCRGTNKCSNQRVGIGVVVEGREGKMKNNVSTGKARSVGTAKITRRTTESNGNEGNNNQYTTTEE